MTTVSFGWLCQRPDKLWKNGMVWGKSILDADLIWAGHINTWIEYQFTIKLITLIKRCLDAEILDYNMSNLT